MSADKNIKLERISELFETEKPLSSSLLPLLSDLNQEELKHLSNIWQKADTDRKLSLINELTRLSEIDLKLDFSSVFLLALTDLEPEIRTTAIMGLESEEKPNLVTPLIKILEEDKAADVRAAAAMALGNLTMQCVEGKLSESHCNHIYSSLLGVVDNKSESSSVRKRALEAISPFGTVDVKERIKRSYNENDSVMKLGALFSMGRTCDTTWLHILLNELQESSAEFRYEAANALGELGVSDAIPDLIRATQDNDPEVQETAIMALGKIGGNLAEEHLRKLATDGDGRIADFANSALEEMKCNELLPDIL